MKKILMSGFLVIAAVIALIITLMVDPYSAKFKKTLDNFHQNFVFVDGYLKDEYAVAVDQKIKDLEAKTAGADQAIKAEKDKTQKADLEKAKQADLDLLGKLKTYQQDLTSKVEGMMSITDKEIMSKIVQDVQKIPLEELKLKTMEALPGVKKVLDAALEIENGVLPELKEVYSPVKLSELKALYADAQGVSGNKQAMLKLIKYILIFIIVVAAGGTFILIERRARKSGEIKASEIV